jgi:hypothetical protein
VPKVALRPKLGFKSMATTTPSGPNTGGGKLAKGAATIVVAFGSASKGEQSHRLKASAASRLASWGRFLSAVVLGLGYLDLLNFDLGCVTHLDLQSLEHW